jgi:hypothetical protein
MTIGEPLIITSIQEDADNSNTLNIKFEGSFELCQCGLDIEDAINDTVDIFHTIRNEMEDNGINGGHEKFVVNIDEIKSLTINDNQLNDDEFDAILQENFRIER